MIRSRLERLRSRKGQHGYTLVEVVATVVILGIIMVPLGTAMVVGFRTVFGIQQRLANSADVQRLSAYFPSDVASVDSDGVNPARVEDQGICKANATEQSLITFRWDKDLGENGQTVVRYLARGSGKDSEVVRRICRGSAQPVETVLANHFGEAGGAEASSYLVDPNHTDLPPTPICGTRLCYIDIHGAYDFHLDAQRRVEGDSGTNKPPGAPTNVHALGGYQRVRLFWTDPVDTGGLPITGYYVEATPGGIVGGANPVFYPPGSGNAPGALISGLTNFQSYTFRVRAVTIIGNGPWSAPSPAVTPGPTTPEPPTLDTAAGDPATNGVVNGNWSLSADYSDGGSPITGFRLTATDPSSTPTVVTFNNPAARSGAVPGLVDNTRYTVQVTALNSYGEGSASQSIAALTLPGKPGTPTAAGSGTAGTVILTFTPPTSGDFADFTNFRAKVGATFSAPVAAATACPTSASCSITVTGVNVNSSTVVSVQAQNTTGWGTLSDPLTIAADTTPPTVAITTPTNAGQYGSGTWNAACSNAGGAVCGTAADAPPGGVASVTVTIRRSSDNRYWNGNPGTSNSSGQPWASSSAVNLTATGTTSWSRALTTASLQTGVTYTVTAVAKDSVNLSSTTATSTFTYLTGAPTTAFTAPASGAKIHGAVTISGTATATSPATVASVEFQYSPAGAGTWTSIAIDVATPYSTSWDTTAVADGSYDLQMIVTDSAGNTNTAVRTITVDNTAPTGSITAPTNGGYVHGNAVAVTSDSADAGSGVANATFQFKPTAGVTWTTIGSDATSPYTVNWNTTALSDGSYDLQVITTDNAGNTFTSAVITVLVDNTAPTIGAPNIVGTLGANGWYTSNVTVTWPAPTDAGSGIASTTGCGTTNITVNTSGQVVSCSATDNAGNTASSSTTIKVDKNAPTGNLTAPANGALVTGSVTVSSDSADIGSGVANATFQSSPAGANTWTTIGAPDVTSPYSVSWNTAVLANGSYDLRVITTDNAGLTFTSATRTVTVDATAPTVTITFPANAGQYNAAGYAAGCVTNNVCGTASDVGTGVSTVTLTIQRSSDSRYWNGTAGTSTSQWLTTPTNLAATGTTTWNRVFTTASLQTNVSYTIVATATDGVGLTGTDSNVFVYDTTAPTGSITAPSAGANVKGNAVTISSNSADTAPGTVASAVFQRSPIGANTWTTIATDTVSPYTTAWDTTVLTDGQYDLRVITTDAAGNTFTSAIVTVRVDNTLPTGSITAPSAGANVKGNAVAVSSNSADAGAGVLNATFQRSPIGANTWTQIGAADTTSPYSVTWDTTAVADGQYDLRVLTTDNAGNVFTSPIVTVRVDNNGPTIGAPIVVGTLGANGWYTSNVTVNWPAPTDSGSGIASTTGCGTTNITTDQTGQVVTCSATDNAGNTSSNSVTIKRDATAPTGSLTAPANGAVVAGTGTVTVSSDSADVTSGVANATFQSSPAGANTWSTIGAPDTTSPYSVSWNVVPLADGSYDLRVVTTDNAGLTFTSAIRTVYVDKTAPTMTITKPVDGSAYNAAGWATGCATNDVCGTAADAVPGSVSTVTITIQRSSDNRYWNGTAGTTTSQWLTTPTNLALNGTTAWNRVFTTASLSTNVTYTVVGTATDSVGLTGTDTNVFVYDTTAPTGSITAPSAGANVKGNAVTISSNSADTAPGTVASAVFQRSPIGANTWTTIATDTVSPYTTAWDTTVLTDGQYDLRVITTDAAGNTFTSAIVTVRVDNTLPTGSITAPSAGANVKGTTVAVSSNSADAGSGVLNATFQRSPIGADTWTQIGAADTTSPYSVTWDTTAVADGQYDLRVLTTDNAGNVFTSAIVTVRVDNTVPSITPNVTGTLGTNGWYTSNVAVTWTVTDNGSGIASTTGCGTTNITTDQTGQVVTCSATDNAGNTTNQSVTIKRDATNPTGSLTAPANGATVASTVTVSSDSADVTSGVTNATFQSSPAGAGTWSTIGAPDTTSPYSVSWNTAVLTQGSYDLRVVTTDNAGNVFTSATRTVFVDSVPPTVTIVKPIDTGAYNAAGWATGCATNDICGTASDTAPGTVASVTVTIQRSSDSRYWNGTAGTTTSQWLVAPTNLAVNGTTAWNRVFTTASLQTNVTYTVIATATDSSALTGTDTAAFVYDTTAPTGSITAPSAAANVRGNAVTVSSNSADTAPGTVASATFQRSPTGANTWTTIGAPDTTSPYSVAWDTTAVADGQYDLRVITTDAAGNTFTSATVTVRVDNTLPTGSLTAPNAGAIVKGAAVAVSSNSADGGSGVLNADFQRSPSGANTWTSIATDTTSPYSISWNTTTLTDGAYDLRVVTTDNAGNQFTSPIRTVTVDNVGPIITGNATGTVGSNGWYTTNVGLTWTVTDSPGSGVATTTNCGPQNVVADTTSTGVSFTCSATDNAGNTSNGTVTIKRDATNPTGSLTAPSVGTVHGTITVSSNSADVASGVLNAQFQRSPTGLNTWTPIATDTTSPYSTTWDTTTVADGTYDLRVVTTDNVGLTFTSAIVTVTVDNTKPVPTSVVLSGSGGTSNGQAGVGDKITITYSEPLAVNTLCTSWAGNGSDQTISGITATLNNNSTSDFVTLGGVCANVGNIDTNVDYITFSSRTWNNSTIAWTAATKTLTITFGGTQSGGTTQTVGSNVVPTYTPTVSITDVVGNTMNATGFNGTASRF